VAQEAQDNLKKIAEGSRETVQLLRDLLSEEKHASLRGSPGLFGSTAYQIAQQSQQRPLYDQHGQPIRYDASGMSSTSPSGDFQKPPNVNTQAYLNEPRTFDQHRQTLLGQFGFHGLNQWIGRGKAVGSFLNETSHLSWGERIKGLLWGGHVPPPVQKRREREEQPEPMPEEVQQFRERLDYRALAGRGIRGTGVESPAHLYDVEPLFPPEKPIIPEGADLPTGPHPERRPRLSPADVSLADIEQRQAAEESARKRAINLDAMEVSGRGRLTATEPPSAVPLLNESPDLEYPRTEQEQAARDVEAEINRRRLLEGTQEPEPTKPLNRKQRRALDRQRLGEDDAGAAGAVPTQPPGGPPPLGAYTMRAADQSQTLVNALQENTREVQENTRERRRENQNRTPQQKAEYAKKVDVATARSLARVGMGPAGQQGRNSGTKEIISTLANVGAVVRTVAGAAGAVAS
jgi:hypothetical protein